MRAHGCFVPFSLQVRIDGRIEKMDQKATHDIWRGFPRAAQLTHSASRQGEVLTKKEVYIHTVVQAMWQL